MVMTVRGETSVLTCTGSSMSSCSEADVDVLSCCFSSEDGDSAFGEAGAADILALAAAAAEAGGLPGLAREGADGAERAARSVGLLFTRVIASSSDPRMDELSEPK
jgi:hypothetical protein